MDNMITTFSLYPLFLWSVAGLIIAASWGAMLGIDAVLTERKHIAMGERNTALDGFEII